MAPQRNTGLRDLTQGAAAGDAPKELALAGAAQGLPWFVLPLAGPFGLIVAATMTWLNLQSM